MDGDVDPALAWDVLSDALLGILAGQYITLSRWNRWRDMIGGAPTKPE